MGRYLIAGKMDEAEALAEDMQGTQADANQVANAFYNLGVCHLKAGRSPEARKWFDHVSKEFPETTWAGMARAYLARPPLAAATAE